MAPAPHFLGIGAQKAGTTWLYANLSAQPGIWLPPVKELHYFDEKARLEHPFVGWRVFGRSEVDQRWRRQARDRWRAWRRGGRRPGRWEFRYLCGWPSDDWYRRLFEPGRGRVTGEVTPSYMTLPRAEVQTVHGLLPDARLILMVRNPIERAWSGSTLETSGLSPARVADALPEIIESEGSRLRTDYLRALDNWTAWYPPEHIYLAFMEDLAERPRLLLSDVCQFLGGGPADDFSRAERVVHRGTVSSMPAGVAARLAELYGPLSRGMAERFGGYAHFWAFCAERLAAGAAGAEEIPYPFSQTRLWEEWVASGGRPPAGLQSGPLDRVEHGR